MKQRLTFVLATAAFFAVAVAPSGQAPNNSRLNADTLMVTRGILRSIIPPVSQKPIALRVSGGPSILKELSNEEIAVDIDDAIRCNASAMAVHVFIGGEYESHSVINMTKLVDAGIRAGIPVMAVTAVGK
jgi:putative autoinducer-2 (AI-2) aldolase